MVAFKSYILDFSRPNEVENRDRWILAYSIGLCILSFLKKSFIVILHRTFYNMTSLHTYFTVKLSLLYVLSFSRGGSCSRYLNQYRRHVTKVRYEANISGIRFDTHTMLGLINHRPTQTQYAPFFLHVATLLSVVHNTFWSSLFFAVVILWGYDLGLFDCSLMLFFITLTILPLLCALRSLMCTLRSWQAWQNVYFCSAGFGFW